MKLLHIAPVVPVVVLESASDAVPLAQALLDGGIGIIEVTLRTPAALPAIEYIAKEVPQMVVGAGTVTSPRHAVAAADVGAQFLVSPGTTSLLLDALTDTGLPFLPGVATVSDIVAVLEHGITEMKFFPAAASGGTATLRAFAGPLPEARFCPTGGIAYSSAAEYLSLPNVGCVGGSWLTPATAIASGKWDHIRRLAAQAAALAGPTSTSAG